jgi:hypothetical protein
VRTSKDTSPEAREEGGPMSSVRVRVCAADAMQPTPVWRSSCLWLLVGGGVSTLS